MGLEAPDAIEDIMVNSEAQSEWEEVMDPIVEDNETG